ncbi:MAG: hypothetical protein SO022_00210 [Selenomonadaceae bacterium]|nr:hypothetical protein [Selenomonadaceae bacterium]
MGYIRSIRNYLQTPKGWHDTVDYLRAVAIIIAVAIGVLLLVYMGENL